MSTMLVELYDALKEAGASEEKARAAAESLLLGHDRLERIEENRQNTSDRKRHRTARQKTRGHQGADRSLKRMNGIVIAGVLALIIETFYT